MKISHSTKTFNITSLSPLLQNRKSFMLDSSEDETFTKQKAESYSTFEERIWKLKAHVNSQGYIFAPGEWFRRALIDSQIATRNPIKPQNSTRKDDTMRPYFTSGLIIDDAIIQIPSKGSAATVDNLTPFKAVVTPNKGSVISIRPMLPEWSLTLEIIITDSTILEKNIREALEWVGFYSGIGDFRPQKGGKHGRFQVS